MPTNFTRVTLKGYFVLLVMLLAPVRPALGQADTTLARRLESDILALVADYAQPARDTILAELTVLHARRHPDSAVAFARQHRVASVASLQRLIHWMEDRGLLRHALALIDAAQGDSVEKARAAGRAIRTFATLCAELPVHTIPVFLAVVKATPDSLGSRALQGAIRKARSELGIATVAGDHCISVLRDAMLVEPAQMVVRDPDAILKVLDAPPREPAWEYTLRMTAIRFGELRRFEDGFRVAERLRDEVDRLQVQLRLAASPGGTDDATRATRILEEAKRTLDPQNHYRAIASFMIPVMNASGLQGNALRWAESQPPGRRAFALLAILMSLD